MSSRKDTSLLLGLHPVMHALEAGHRTCFKLIVEAGNSSARLNPLFALARQKNVKVEEINQKAFKKKYGSGAHQGVAGLFTAKTLLDLETLIEQAGKRQTVHPVLVALDGVQDPHNLGAVIRSAEALGLAGMIVPKHRSAPLNDTVAKCSAGAMESLEVAQVTNMVPAMERLKEAGYQVVGLDVEGDTACQDFETSSPVVIVLGGEEKGIRPLLKKQCDVLLTIPMSGQVQSLNASTSAAIAFYQLTSKTGKSPSI